MIGSCTKILSQCTDDGPRSGSSATNNNDVGTVSYLNTSNCFSSDDNYASATAVVLGDITEYLAVTGFGFSIGASTNICGITVEIEKKATGILQNVQDNSVKIIKNGSVTGNEKALAGSWPTTDAYSSYGGTSDLWGTTWTSTDINATNFGVAISANLSGISALPTAKVDHVRITVTFETLLPIELREFTSTRIDDSTVRLDWTTSSEINNEYFTIERSQSNDDWEVIDYVNGAGTSNIEHTYGFLDHHYSLSKTYYRIKQTDYDGTFSYSPTEFVPSSSEYNGTVKVYPNPFSRAFNVIGNIEVKSIFIYDQSGNRIYSKNFDCSAPGTLSNHPIALIEPGLFFIKVVGCEGDIYLNKLISY